jgi:hypothetical protein
MSGLLYPLQIFSNYGYTIVENQNLFFLHSAIFNPLITYFFLLIPLLLISLITLVFHRKYWHSSLLFLFTILAFYQIRHLPFFVLTAIPCVSLGISLLVKRLTINNGTQLIGRFFYIGLSSSMIIFFMSNTYYHLFDINKTFGISVHDDTQKASQFMLQHKLPGPVFNDFDIGGYAIYSLYPRYKVFVDNRPEAYPADWLQNTYIQLQENADLQNKVFRQYHIQTIYFTHSDQTPWAETFLQRLFLDHSWNIVYLDSTIVIATKAQLKDIRNDDSYLSQLIQQQPDYLHLLHLARLFSLMKKSSLASEAFSKANDLNSSSCAAKRILNYQHQNSPQLYLTDDVRKQFWYCF